MVQALYKRPSANPSEEAARNLREPSGAPMAAVQRPGAGIPICSSHPGGIWQQPEPTSIVCMIRQWRHPQVRSALAGGAARGRRV